jgi:hypothetical protein
MAKELREYGRRKGGRKGQKKLRERIPKRLKTDREDQAGLMEGRHFTYWSLPKQM